MAVYGNIVAQTYPYRTTHPDDPKYAGYSGLIWFQKFTPGVAVRVTSVMAYIANDSHSETSTCYVKFWDSDGNVLGTTSSYEQAGYEGWGWHELTCDVTLATSGVQYYYSVHSSSSDDEFNVRWAYNDSVPNNQAPQYTNPNNVPSSFTYTGNLCVYFNYDLVTWSGNPTYNTGNTSYSHLDYGVSKGYAVMIPITMPSNPDPNYEFKAVAIKFYAKPQGGVPAFPVLIRPVIWRASDGAVITDGAGPGDYWTALTGYQWHTHTYVTKPSLQQNTTYYIGGVLLGGVGYANALFAILSGGIKGGVDSTNDYNSPQTYNGATGDTAYAIYLVYELGVPEGPQVLIEGISPGKLEYTSWSELSDVR